MPPISLGRKPRPALPRIITYYQTHHDSATGEHISVLPLVQKPGICLTHLILAAVHINADPAAITLNDHAPTHPRFTALWAELRILQASGIKVLAMLGGAAQGSYERLDVDPAKDPYGERFEAYYAPLAAMVRERALDGLDLDVEEPMSLAGIVRLIDRLRADFGPDFLITLAPVAAALLDPRRNLSGFDYAALEAARGREIAWYNAQFYCGWGDCGNPAMYELLVMRGWRPDRLVVGLLTNPENGGSGFVPIDVLANVLPVLLGRHPGFGGVMGWEYFNSLPGGTESPWEWAEWMTALLRGEEGAVGQRIEVHEQAGLVGAGGGIMGKDAAGEAKELDPDDETSAAVKEAPLPETFEYYSDYSDGWAEEED